MAKLNKTGIIFLCFLFLFTCKDEPVIKYTLKLSTTEGGTASIISPAGTSATEGTYNAGTKITVKAMPKEGYIFSYISRSFFRVMVSFQWLPSAFSHRGSRNKATSIICSN